MRLIRELCGDGTLSYLYPNDSFSKVELWVARPPETVLQDKVEIDFCSHQPIETVWIGGNQVDRFSLRAFHELRINWSFRRWTARIEEGRGQDPSLSTDERTFYLASSPQIPKHQEIDAEAARLVAGLSDPMRVAQALFYGVSKECRYSYPVPRRGAVDMLISRHGDCGQFSVLLVALLRARGVPARPLFGTVVLEKGAVPHAWVELWIDGVGWIAADPTVANVEALSILPRAKPRTYFGDLGGSYFAFSIGVDLEFGMRYGSPVRPVPLPVFAGRRPVFGGRTLFWGFDTIDGRAPYLQPSYPRCARGVGLNALVLPSQLGYWAASSEQFTRARLRLFLRSIGILLMTAVIALDLLLIPSGAVLWHLVTLALVATLFIGARSS